MRRWLVILMLFCVPFQMAWAAASPYCMHERASMSKHFGHHEHVHENAKGQPAAEDAGIGASHNDCGSCHMFHAAWIGPTDTTHTVAVRAIGDYFEPRYVSRVPPAPERPQRVEPFSAVRSGVGALLSISTP